MKKVYIIYGEGPCGKTEFIDSVVRPSGECLDIYDEINPLLFYTKQGIGMKTYKNIIIDGWTNLDSKDLVKTKKLSDQLKQFKNNYENIFITCQSLRDVVGLCDILDYGKFAKIKFLNFED